MTILTTKIDTNSLAFKDNHEAIQIVVDDLNDKLSAIALGGNEKARAKHLGRGKLPSMINVRWSNVVLVGLRAVNVWLCVTTPLLRAAPTTP